MAYSEKELSDGAVFLARMMPHLLDGKTLEEAGWAVLADDERLFLAAAKDTEQGRFIRSEMARLVYERARK